MPVTAPSPVLPPAAGGEDPAAPSAVLGAVSEGGSPTAPSLVLPSSGATDYGVTITGTSGADGALANVGDSNDDGYDTFNGSSSQAYWSAGNWVIQAAGYSAFKTSAAATPVGLVGWTITLGAGQPTVGVAVIAAPSPVLGAVDAGGEPTAPSAVLAVSVAFSPVRPRGVIEPAGGWPGALTYEGSELTYDGETLAYDPT